MKDRYVGSSDSPRFPSFYPAQNDRRIGLERLLYRLNKAKLRISDEKEGGLCHVRASYVHLWQACEIQRSFDYIIEIEWTETRINEVDTINKGPKCSASMRFINHSGSFLKIEQRAKRHIMGI